MTLEQIEVSKRMARLGAAVKRATSKVKRNGRNRVRRADALTLEQLKAQKGLSLGAFAKRFVP